MAQAQLRQSVPVPAAAESLASMHALFNAQSRGGLHYDNLPQNVRATLCFSASLSPHHTDMKLADMSDFERVKLFKAINRLVSALKPLMSCPLSEFH